MHKVLTGISLVIAVMAVLGLVWFMNQQPTSAEIAAQAAQMVEVPQGEIGNDGPQGPEGPRGPQGPKGDDGMSVDVEQIDALEEKVELLEKSVDEFSVIVLGEAQPINQPAEKVEIPNQGTVELTSSFEISATGNFTPAMGMIPQTKAEMGQWTVEYFTGATTLMRDFVFTDIITEWVEFPNVDWPAGDFLAKDGLEFGQELSDFCQGNLTCDWPVAARSFRSITADYSIEGVGECRENGTGIGCAVVLVNMGDVTASFRAQNSDTGHTVTGLYWNGDEADRAISAWASHIVYRMVGVPDDNPASPGANCSVPEGCKGLDITLAIFSGNELLVRGHTVYRPSQ